LSIKEQDKGRLPEIASKLKKLGFSLVATKGTAHHLRESGFEVEVVNKVREGSPHIVDKLGQGEISLVLNTPEGLSLPVMDSKSIRMVANELRIPTYTTIAAADAVASALGMVQDKTFLEVRALQDYY